MISVEAIKFIIENEVKFFQKLIVTLKPEKAGKFI